MGNFEITYYTKERDIKTIFSLEAETTEEALARFQKYCEKNINTDEPVEIRKIVTID